jgi:hypothetical protein
MKHEANVMMMWEMTTEEIVRWAREQEPTQGVVRILCELLEDRENAGRPKPRSWESVWGEFDEKGRTTSFPH